MRKFISLLIIASLILSMVGCSSGADSEIESSIESSLDSSTSEIKQIATFEKESIIYEMSIEETKEILQYVYSEIEGMPSKYTTTILDYWNEEEFEDYSSIHELELNFLSLYMEVEEMETVLKSNEPKQKELIDIWDELKNSITTVKDALYTGYTLDINQDGIYIDSEMIPLLEEITDIFVSDMTNAIECHDKLIIKLEKYSDIEITADSDYCCIECGKSANKIFPNSKTGKVAYYCSKHYEEIINEVDNANDFLFEITDGEENICIVCGKPSDKLYVNLLNNESEYYCSKHYQEIIDMIDNFAEIE